MNSSVATVLAIMLFLLTGCASTSQTNSGPGISASTALDAMNKFVANPVGANAEAYLSIAMNYVEKNDDTLVSIDKKYFPPEYDRLHMDNRSHLLGAYVTGNARYQLANGIVDDKPDEGIRIMVRAYRALVNAGRMREYQSFNNWLRQNGLN